MIFPFITSIYLFVDFHRDSTSVKKCQKVGLGGMMRTIKKDFPKQKIQNKISSLLLCLVWDSRLN